MTADEVREVEVEAELVGVLAGHRGVLIQDGGMWCSPCGALLWTARDGFEGGPLKMIGSVAETAHAHHLASVLAPLHAAERQEAAREALLAALDDLVPLPHSCFRPQGCSICGRVKERQDIRGRLRDRADGVTGRGER